VSNEFNFVLDEGETNPSIVFGYASWFGKTKGFWQKPAGFLCLYRFLLKIKSPSN
jgi:hypothetical protein